MHVKHKSLIFEMEKTLVNNYIFEIDIKKLEQGVKYVQR